MKVLSAPTLVFLICILLTAFMVTCGGGGSDTNSAGSQVAGDDDDSPYYGDDDTPDDDDDSDDDDDIAQDDDDDNDNDDDDDDDSSSDSISILIYDLATTEFLEDVQCELVNNDTGESESPPIVRTSDSNGKCEFQLPSSKRAALFSVKLTLTGFVKTYAFKYESDVAWNFAMLSPSVRDGIYSAVGDTVDTAKATLAGTVLWDDGEDHKIVGCAGITSQPVADTYYLDQAGSITDARSNTHPENGYFLLLNADTVGYTVSSDIDGYTQMADFPITFANSIVYRNLVYSNGNFPDNPTPEDCAK